MQHARKPCPVATLRGMSVPFPVVWTTYRIGISCKLSYSQFWVWLTPWHLSTGAPYIVFEGSIIIWLLFFSSEQAAGICEVAGWVQEGDSAPGHHQQAGMSQLNGRAAGFFVPVRELIVMGRDNPALGQPVADTCPSAMYMYGTCTGTCVGAVCVTKPCGLIVCLFVLQLWEAQKIKQVRVAAWGGVFIISLPPLPLPPPISPRLSYILIRGRKSSCPSGCLAMFPLGL